MRRLWLPKRRVVHFPILQCILIFYLLLLLPLTSIIYLGGGITIYYQYYHLQAPFTIPFTNTLFTGLHGRIVLLVLPQWEHHTAKSGRREVYRWPCIPGIPYTATMQMKSIDYDYKKYIDVEWFEPYMHEHKKNRSTLV